MSHDNKYRVTLGLIEAASPGELLATGMYLDDGGRIQKWAAYRREKGTWTMRVGDPVLSAEELFVYGEQVSLAPNGQPSSPASLGKAIAVDEGAASLYRVA